MPSIASGDTAPIGDHALVSNCRGAALVTSSGTIDWACLPRFDSPSSFGSLLGEGAGHWALRPAETSTAARRYLPATMVLATTWRTDDAEVEVWDLLPFGPREREHAIGMHAPAGIVRVVHGRRGRMRMASEMAIRPEYGLVVPLLTTRPGGGVRAHGGDTAMSVASPVVPRCDGGTISVEVEVDEGERLAFGLLRHDPWTDPPAVWEQDEMLALADDTVEAWRSWTSAHQSYDGPYADLVAHSGRVLQALTYAPSGAVVAAPTTSLPESPGGGRNWDYRYAWVRDASITLEALWVAACPDEAERLFAFFAAAAGSQLDGQPLPVMYGVGGERHLPEVEIDHLDGFDGSRPVRVGNGAWDQTQLDVYGELLSAAWQLVDQLDDLDATTVGFLRSLADGAARHWQDPDRGIWEARDKPRHFTYSKLMCWVALDRAVKMADRLGAAERVDEWASARDEIGEAILERAWNAEVGAFTQAFDSTELDASVLMMAIVGFLPATDTRMRATIEAIAAQLTDRRGFVYRYRSDDGLEGAEGTFAICTFWLAHCWALAGEVGRARALFDEMASCANDVGLLAEQLEADTGRQLGNFPQAFTHIGLINAAWAIHRAEQEA